LYTNATQGLLENTRVISTDEKSGMQALERKFTPMKSGKVERQDHEYIRHGTQCLIANLDIATGQIIAPTIGDTRTEVDFVNHIKKTVATDPNKKWIFVTDQLNIHKSEGLVRFVAELEGVDQTSLGKKTKHGIVKNMVSREKFLTNQEHQVSFVYTPKHSSWLNQIECWFSILARRLLKRLVTVSVDELKAKVMSFIEYHNSTTAKPLKWLCSRKIKRSGNK
jgi:transposase